MNHAKKDSNVPFIPLTRDKFDPMGSYTGRATDPRDEPVQDADDL